MIGLLESTTEQSALELPPEQDLTAFAAWLRQRPGPVDEHRLFDLVEAHLRRSWEHGSCVLVEDYVANLPDRPEFASAAALSADLVEAEFVARHTAGRHADHPGLDEYERRFPDRVDLQEHLRRKLMANGRYARLSVIGSGGVGEVWVAYDFHLARQVAIKIPLERICRDPVMLDRLKREAKITARLNHPAIISVHEYVDDATARPFYVMPLVGGPPLDQVIKEFHAQRDNLSPSEQRLAENRLLQNFCAVCAAVTYAHSQGIVHRDLKPGNINVGPFGETIVLDWGMACQSGRLAADSPAALRAGDRSVVGAEAQDTDATQDTSFGGTPGFMAPERFDPGRSDARTDVYSLGATLYVLLTGKSTLPADGRWDENKLLEWARKPSLVPPRTLRPSIPKPLEAICLKALAPRRQDRYATPAELQSEIERWLADEPVQSLPEPLAAGVKRWTRRHPKTIASLAASLLIGLVSLAAIALVVVGKNEQLATTNASLKTQRDRAKTEEETAKLATTDMQAILAFLEAKVLAAGRPDPEYGGLGVDVTLRAVVDEAEKQIASSFRDQPHLEAAIRNTLGVTYLHLGEDELAVRQHERALELRLAKLGAEHPDTFYSMDNLGLAYHSVGRLDEALPLLEKTLKLRKAKLGLDDPETLRSMNNLAIAYRAVGKLELSLPLHEETLKRRIATLGKADVDTFASMNNLGKLCISTGDHKRGLALHKEVFALTSEKLGPNHADTLSSMHNLALAHKAESRLDLAVPLLEKALELRTAKLGPEHPATLQSMASLGQAYGSAGRPKEALPLCEEALRLRQYKLGPEHRDTLMSMNDVAILHKAAGRFDLAIPLFEETLKLQTKVLGAKHPDTLATKNNLGVALHAHGRLEEAESVLEETFEHMKEKYGPKHPRTLNLMVNLGDLYGARKKHDLALPLLKEGLELHRSELGPEHEGTLAAMHSLAGAYSSAGKHDLALPLFEAALRLSVKTQGVDHPHTLIIRNNLGKAYQEAGQLDKAVPLLEENYSLFKAKLEPNHPHSIQSLASLVEALFKDRQSAKALSRLDELVGLERANERRDDSAFSGMLAANSSFLLTQGHYVPAEKYLRECLAIREKTRPDDWTTFNTRSLLGGALAGQKKYAEAEPLLLAGYEGMKSREDKIPPQAKIRLAEAVRRLIDFYTAWEKPDEAAKWKNTLDSK